MTEAIYYILLALQEPMHGYGIMQKTSTMSNGRLILSAGTLYLEPFGQRMDSSLRGILRHGRQKKTVSDYRRGAGSPLGRTRTPGRACGERQNDH